VSGAGLLEVVERDADFFRVELVAVKLEELEEDLAVVLVHQILVVPEKGNNHCDHVIGAEAAWGEGAERYLRRLHRSRSGT
jgi:hypothetical protein